MLSSVVRHGAVYTLGAVISRGLSFFLLPLYTHALSPAGYGLLDYLTVIGSLVAVSLALEVSQALGRFLPDRRDDAAGKRSLSSTAVWFTIAVHLLLLALVTALRDPIAALLFDKNAVGAAAALPWAAGAYLTNALVNLARNQLRFELRPKASTLVAVVHAAGVLSLTALLLLTAEQPEPARALLGVIGGGVVASIVGAVLAWRAISFRFSLHDLRMMLVFSTPLVFSSVGVILSQLVDRLIINSYLGLEALAPYALAFRVSLVVTLAMVGFQGALTPLIYTHHRESGTPGQIATLYRWFVAMALLLFTGITLTDRWIIALIAPLAYAEAEHYVPLLVLSNVVAAMYIFMPGMGLARRTAMIAAVNLAGAAVNLGLNLVLIPRLGPFGAALATLAGASMAFLGYLYFSQRFYPVPHNWLRLVVSAVAVIAVVLLIDDRTASDLHAALMSALGLLIALAVIHLSGVLRFPEVRDFLRQILRPAAPSA